MILDGDSCFRALESRDRRFQGRFVVAVKTTGIYCRPGCPARLPRRENVLFLACAAAAEANGFRPCLRCRPDAAPGSPADAGTSATVTRALRLIAEHSKESASVGVLAGRLGVGARHLRRLFAEQLGASPIAVVETQRVHFARKLLDETDLPMTAVAMAAGYGSVRRFNHAIRTTFRSTPSDLRNRLTKTRSSLSDGKITLRLPFRPPFDWDATASFLAARAIPSVELVDGERYSRTVIVDGVTGVIEVRPVAGAEFLHLTTPLSFARSLQPIVERARRLFDLAADPIVIAAHLARDPRLAPLVARRPGLRVPGAWDPFELAVRAILGQQVTVRGATTLAGRLAARFGRVIEGGAVGLTHLFPEAAALAVADLTKIGMPGARARSIVSLARAVADSPSLLDGAHAGDAWRSLPGIGPWTASYIAMRAHHEPDEFPSGDLVLARALGLEKTAAVEERAERWRPWRAYAALHLWNKGANE